MHGSFVLFLLGLAALAFLAIAVLWSFPFVIPAVLVLAVLAFMGARARGAPTMVDRVRKEPTGVPRKSSGGVTNASQRIGQE